MALASYQGSVNLPASASIRFGPTLSLFYIQTCQRRPAMMIPLQLTAQQEVSRDPLEVFQNTALDSNHGIEQMCAAHGYK